MRDCIGRMMNSGKTASAFLAFILGCMCSPAQQTGTVLGATPGSALGHSLRAVPVTPPAPTCESPGVQGGNASPSLPDMLFLRPIDELVCLRHRDGHSEKLLKGGPWMQVSPGGNQVAYWLPEKHELHVFSLSNRNDVALDSVPDGNMRQIVWSSNGQALAYLLTGTNVRGLRVVDMRSGARHVITGIFGTLAASPDPDYLIGVNAEGVHRIKIADGRQDLIAALEDAADGAYSPRGTWLGVLASQPSTSTATDDEPDCTGGTFALILQKAAAKQVIKVPFPPGFDSVLDFAFAPDESAIAVTFGAAACDYPGDVARVYLFSLVCHKLNPISPPDRLSVKAHWSPESRVVIYSDYSGSDSPLMAFDIQNGKATRLTNPDQWGPDEFLAWRAEAR